MRRCAVTEHVGATAYETYLAEAAARRERAGLSRRLTPRSPQPAAIDLSGNDYLGLARHPEVVAAAAEAARRWGAGATSSRLVTGSLTLHARLEEALAGLMGQPRALVFSTGYHANLAAVTALADRNTVVVSDAHIHASLVDAARLSRARVAIVPHNDVSAIETALWSRPEARALVLTESVYSVLGDASPLPAIVDVAQRHDALVLVDEAHGLGTRGTDGAGLVREHGLTGHRHVLVTATLSKSLGSQGGAVLGSEAVVDHLINAARPFIYDTGLAPAAAAAADAAIRVMLEEPERVIRVRALARRMATALEAGVPDAAVFSVPLPTADAAVAAAATTMAAGVRVGCFRPPSVPDGVSRLRMTASAGLSDTEVEAAIAVVSKTLASTADDAARAT
jgi:8-amino-7-oxononanoate synthase